MSSACPHSEVAADHVDALEVFGEFDPVDDDVDAPPNEELPAPLVHAKLPKGGGGLLLTETEGTEARLVVVGKMFLL